MAGIDMKGLGEMLMVLQAQQVDDDSLPALQTPATKALMRQVVTLTTVQGLYDRCCELEAELRKEKRNET